MAAGAFRARITVNGTEVDQAAIWFSTDDMSDINRTIHVAVVKQLSADDLIKGQGSIDASGFTCGANITDSVLSAIKISEDPPA